MSEPPFSLSLRKAPHGRGWPHYAVGVVLHAAIFAACGPLIGVFAAGGVVGVVTIFPLFTAYAMGAGSAAASAGACVAVASSFVSAPWKLYGISAATGFLSSVLLLQRDFAGRSDADLLVLFLGIIGAFASVACTGITRGLRLHPGNAFFSVPHGTGSGTDAH